MTSLESSFTKLLGRTPSDEERQELLRVRDALDLRDNDALWLIVMANQHFRQQFAKMPEDVSEVVKDVLQEARTTANETMKAAAVEAKAELRQAVATAVQRSIRTSTWETWLQWVLCAAMVLAVSHGCLAWWMYRDGNTAGFREGKAAGYEQARNEEAAASWANTREGKLAHALSNAGSVEALVFCNRRGWVRENGVCWPQAVKDGEHRGKVFGWAVPNLGDD